jgi:mono/diheme cytochrome c family protein
MISIRFICLGVLLALAPFALAQDATAPEFTSAQIKAGADLFARHCSPCHGMRMIKPEVDFDLRKFPRDQPGRFANSVTNGKNAMPPWSGLLKPGEIDALWAYVIAGEKN